MSTTRLPPPSGRPGSPPRASSSQRVATPTRRGAASPPRTAAPPPTVLPSSAGKRSAPRGTPPRNVPLQPAEQSAGKRSYSQRVISAPGSPPKAATFSPPAMTTTATTLQGTGKESLVPAPPLPNGAYPFSARESTVDLMFELEDANFLFYDMLCQEVDQTQRVQFDQLVCRGICHYMDCQRLGTTDEDVWVQIRPGVAHSLLLSYPGERRMPTIADAQWPLRVRVVVRCALCSSSEQIRLALERMSPAAFFDALRCYELWFGRAVDSSRYSILDGIPPETLVSGVAPRGRFSERHASGAHESAAALPAPMVAGSQQLPANGCPPAQSTLRDATRDETDSLPGGVPPPTSIYHRLAQQAAEPQQRLGERSAYRAADVVPAALVHRRDPSSPALRYPDLLPPYRDAENVYTSSVPAFHSQELEPRWEEEQAGRRGAPSARGPTASYHRYYDDQSQRPRHLVDRYSDAHYHRKDEPYRGNDEEYIANRERYSDAQDEKAPQTYRVLGRSHGRGETVVAMRSTSQDRQPSVYVSGDGTEYFVRVSKVVAKGASPSNSQYY